MDLVCTDPPYGCSFRGRVDRKHEPIAGDDELPWVEPVFREVVRVMRRDSLRVGPATRPPKPEKHRSGEWRQGRGSKNTKSTAARS